MIDKTTTEQLLNILKNTDNVSDLKTYVLNVESNISFSDYVSAYIDKHGYDKSEIIRLSDIQRNYGYQILDGSKVPGRDKVLALSLSMHMSLEDTQRCLTISDNGILYSKIKRDSIIIFSLDKKLSVQDTNELLHEMGEEILK